MRFDPATPSTATDLPGRDVHVRGGREVVRGAGEREQDGPEVAGADRYRDAALLADHVLEAERLGRFGMPQEPEDARDEGRPEDPEAGAHERRLGPAQVQDLGAEQAADTEHRDEPEQQRDERDAGEIDPDVEGVEEAAEDVVDEDREQEQAAAHEDAEQEDRVREVDLDHAVVPRPSAPPVGLKDTLGDMGCAAPDVVPWG